MRIRLPKATLDLSSDRIAIAQARKTWAITLENAAKEQIIRLVRATDGSEEMFTQLFDQLRITLCETVKTSTGEHVVCTYTGKDGNTYPQRKGVEVRIHLLTQILGNMDNTEIEALAQSWLNRRNNNAPAQGYNQTDLQKDQLNEHRPDFANQDTYTKVQLMDSLRHIDRLIEDQQRRVDREPNGRNFVKLDELIDTKKSLEAKLTPLLH